MAKIRVDIDVARSTKATQEPRMLEASPDWRGPLWAERLAATDARDVSLKGGLYLWVRACGLDPECAVDSTRFESSVERMVSLPLVRTREISAISPSDAGEIRVRPGLLSFAGLSVGGGAISPAKREHLRSILEDSAFRASLYRFLNTSGSRFGSVLYVGEAGSLRPRISDHLNKKTPLLDRLEELGLGLADAVIYYIVLDGVEAATRTLLEQILTHTFVAPLTRRPG